MSSENLKRILSLVRDVLNNRNESTQLSSTESSFLSQSSSSSEILETNNSETHSITFEEFCVISSYLSVLQQEIEENTCVSPIKGTNLPPPPIYLTNTPGKCSVPKVFIISSMSDNIVILNEFCCLSVNVFYKHQ